MYGSRILYPNRTVILKPSTCEIKELTPEEKRLKSLRYVRDKCDDKYSNTREAGATGWDTMDLGSISRNTSKGSTPLLPTTTLFNNKKYVIYLYSSIKIHTFVTSKQRDIWNMVY